MTLLVTDKENRRLERERVLAERVPPLQMSGLSMQDLQVQHPTYTRQYIQNNVLCTPTPFTFVNETQWQVAVLVSLRLSVGLTDTSNRYAKLLRFFVGLMT